MFATDTPFPRGVSRLNVPPCAVYVGSNDMSVYALNGTTGTPRWAFLTGGEVQSAAAIGGSTVYIGSNDGSLYAIDGTLSISS